MYGWSKVSLAKNAFSDTFDRDIRTNNEFYVAPTYNFMIGQGLTVETVLVGDHGVAVHGLGIPSDLASFLRIPIAEIISMEYKAKLSIG